MQIVVRQLITKKQVELVRALVRKGYFASEAAALAYSDAISDFIKTIPEQTARKTKDTSSGQYYATYKANRQTTWYILFDKSDDRYIIRNLINNHTPDYPKLIARFKGIMKPTITIAYCPKCGWLLRAAYMAQELLTTFTDEVHGVLLHPTEISGRFSISVNNETIFDRKVAGRFPDIKELKQLIRDKVAPIKTWAIPMPGKPFVSLLYCKTERYHR